MMSLSDSLSLFGSNFIADVSTSGSFAITSHSETLLSLREAGMSLACLVVVALHLIVFTKSVVRLLSVELIAVVLIAILMLLVHHLILRRLAVAGLFVPLELVRVDHGEHFGETLSYTGNSLRRVSEGQLVPLHKLNSLSVHVHEILFARSARKTTKRLLGEHGILFVCVAALAHEQVVQILELSFEKFECSLRLILVSELLRQRLHNLVETLHEKLLKLGETRQVSLAVKGVLELLHPAGEF